MSTEAGCDLGLGRGTQLHTRKAVRDFERGVSHAHTISHLISVSIMLELCLVMCEPHR